MIIPHALKSFWDVKVANVHLSGRQSYLSLKVLSDTGSDSIFLSNSLFNDQCVTSSFHVRGDTDLFQEWHAMEHGTMVYIWHQLDTFHGFTGQQLPIC